MRATVPTIRVRARRAVAAALTAALLAMPAATRAQEPPPPSPAPAAATPPGSSRFEGRVFRSDGKTAIEGAVVRLCPLEADRPTAAATSDTKGSFRVEGAAHGLSELTVEAGGAIYAGNQVLQLAPAERKAFDLVLVPDSERPKDAPSRRPPACAPRAPEGSAEVREKKTAGEFARSPKGIAWIASGIAVVLLAVASGGGSGESSASPF